MSKTIHSGQVIGDERLKKILNTKNIYTRIDSCEIPGGSNEVRLFAIARNESLRLPHFLSYYFSLGVDRVFLIDNGSDDDTINIALTYPNVHIFRITDSFKGFWHWIEYFLETYGKDRWCFVVDIDELFKYPDSENVSLRQLLGYLDANSYTAMRSILLDMYPEGGVADAVYEAGNDPLVVCPYFDVQYDEIERNFFDPKRLTWFKYVINYGGMRQRMFGEMGDYKWSYCLSKVSLFKYSDEVYLTEGMHTMNGASFADITGATLHTKFMYDFIEETQVEAEREEHFCDGLEYKFYNYHVQENPDISLCYEGSVRYHDSGQLVELGIMKTSPSFELVCKLVK